MSAFVVGHAAAFVLAVVALGGAALRLAGAAGARPGAERLLAAAPLAAAAAVAEALGLGRLGLSGSPLALGLAAVATWAAVRWRAPRSPQPVLGWGALTAPGRATVFAALAALLAWATWLERYPGLGTDSLAYHLPEAIGWVHSGYAGSEGTFLYLFPVGAYPLTHEVLLSWQLALTRSFVPVALTAIAVVGLLALGTGTAARRLGAPWWAAGGAALAVAALPITVIQVHEATAGTDLAAAAWLACTAALCAGVVTRPGLLGCALVACGLAVGTKPGTAPVAVVALGGAVLAGRRAGSGLTLDRGTGLGLALGLAVSLPWYVRDLVVHGHPLWPFAAGPGGDPQPGVYRDLAPSLLSRPRATIVGREDLYGQLLGGGVVLLVAALLAPLAARRRGVTGLSALAVLAALIWAAGPATGFPGVAALNEVPVTSVRYALPAVLAAVLAVALAGRHRGAGVALAAVALPGALGVDLVLAAGQPFPWRPPLGTMAAAAALGASAGVMTGPGRFRRALGRARRRRVLVVAPMLGAVAAVSLTGPGWVRRHARTKGYDADLTAVLSRYPPFRDGAASLAMAPRLAAALAGDRLQHRLTLIPQHERCPAVRARVRAGWVFVEDTPDFGILPPFSARRCLARLPPLATVGLWRIYARPSLTARG